LKYSLIYPNKKGFCDPDIASELAIKAEEAGFSTFLIWDHYGMPDGPDTVDAWCMLSYVAARTSKIQIGTCVTPIPFRPPAQLAKIVSTVDILSKGRTILGVGAGWHQPEFDAYSVWDSTSVRVNKTIEGIELIDKLWTSETIDHQGQYFVSKEAELEPKPVTQPRPPMWFGVKGPRMMKLAAQYGAAWIPTMISPEEYKEGIQRFSELKQELGKSPDVHGAIQIYEPPQTTDEALRDINSYAEAGCQEYGIVWSYPESEGVKRVEWIANDIMPAF